MKKKVICIVAIAVVVLFVLLLTQAEEIPSTEETTTEATTTEIQTEPTTEMVVTMTEQFMALGFTEEEVKKVKEIFTTVGITEINNIQAVGNAGIDNLQAFKCGIYDSRIDKGGPTLLFTVEKRQVCHISLNGFMNTNSSDYDSIVLYDIWNEDGTINENAVGYKAVVDYENKKITKYEG